MTRTADDTAMTKKRPQETKQLFFLKQKGWDSLVAAYLIPASYWERISSVKLS